MNDLATRVVLVALLPVVVYFIWRRRWLLRLSKDPEEHLLALCLGDKALMERLIHFERQKFPGVSRTEAAERAIVSRRRENM